MSQRNQNYDQVGAIEFGIEYSADAQKLSIEILRAFDLELNDENMSDTFCRCTLMPDKIAHSTKVVKRSKNPIFEQTFEFDGLEMPKLDARFLSISLFQLDKGKEECLGATILKLNYPSIEANQIFLKDLKASLKSNEVN